MHRPPVLEVTMAKLVVWWRKLSMSEKLIVMQTAFAVLSLLI